MEIALELAQTEGLEAVSMRQVASRLEVEAMSLYKHVENKDDLIDGVIEHIIRKIQLPAEKTPWKEALLERARSEHQVLRQHSWIIHLLEARSGTGAERLLQQNHMIGILRRSGFSVELAFQTMIVLTGHVYGFVVFATAWSPQSKERKKTIKKAEQQIRPETHPYVMEAISYAQARVQNQKAQSHPDFEFGLQLILDGIERRLTES
ncbi:MAG: TetR/AcrR family transcriptional regulator C-terminal domain-containing protein [Bdellovibrionaceae bacterium]|nr:TetR/AcrR family transcriptional regulator C-terminal domain-containing protein [Pseudobdellovibrionaceae bacterium]